MGLISEFESIHWERSESVVGIDEAGRGPMAGPLVVAGVIFPKGFDHPLINDSKKLSEKKRTELVDIITSNALWYSLEIIDEKTIDEKNIYKATQDAMVKIANESNANHALTDAMPIDDCVIPFTSVIKGDQRSISIAAASILAKTKRDTLMLEIDAQYPEYGFKNHKGYGTKKHKEAILQYGRCPHHRETFRFKDES